MHRNLLLPVNFLYKDEANLPSKSHSSDSITDLPDHPESGKRTAHWVMQSGHHSCPDTDSVLVVLSETQCSLNVHNSNSKAGSDTCCSSVCTEQESDIPHLLDEGLPPDDALDRSSSQHSLVLLVFPLSHVVDNPVPDTVDPVIFTQPEHIPTDTVSTRAGRTIKPPQRLICEMNSQFVHDSSPSVISLFDVVKSIFHG